jgi:putative membrane protein
MGKILAVGVAGTVGAVGVAVAMVILLAVTGCSKKSKSSVTSLNSTDQQFITNAGYNNVGEIDMGYSASTSAADSNVRVFGKGMVGDYGAAQSDLILLADNFGFTVLSSPDAAHQTLINSLGGLSGIAFDTTYLRAQIDDDQAAISLYQDEQTKSKNQAVIDYIGKYLPVIQGHLSAANQLMATEVGH